MSAHTPLKCQADTGLCGVGGYCKDCPYAAPSWDHEQDRKDAEHGELLAIANACVAQGSTLPMEDWLDEQSATAAQRVRDAAPKNTDRTCPFCNFTGEVDASGSLDCTSCNAATERAALNEFVKAEGRFLADSDLHWLIHLRAFNMARKTVE